MAGRARPLARVDHELPIAAVLVLLDDGMGLVAEVQDADGRRVAVDDPSGGTFDGAGDFDRLIPAKSTHLPLLSSVDPYGEWLVPFDRLPELAAEVAVIRADARPAPEARDRSRTEAAVRAYRVFAIRKCAHGDGVREGAALSVHVKLNEVAKPRPGGG